MDKLYRVWSYLKQLHSDSDNDTKQVTVYVLISKAIFLFYREEIRNLQTNLDYLSNRFTQSQLSPSINKGTNVKTVAAKTT